MSVEGGCFIRAPSLQLQLLAWQFSCSCGDRAAAVMWNDEKRPGLRIVGTSAYLFADAMGQRGSADRGGRNC